MRGSGGDMSYLLLRWQFSPGTDRTCTPDLCRTFDPGGRRIRAIFPSGTRRNEDRRNGPYHIVCLPCIYPNDSQQRRKNKSNQIKKLVRWNLEEINENVKLTQSFNVKKKEIKKRSACDGVHYEMTISLICFGFILVRDAAASGVSRSIATTSSWRPF